MHGRKALPDRALVNEGSIAFDTPSGAAQNSPPPKDECGTRTLAAARSPKLNTFSTEATYANPRRTAAVFARGRIGFSLADTHAMRVERRVHAVPADREATGIRSTHQGIRLGARAQAGHKPAQILPERGGDGCGVRRNERHLWAALRGESGRS